MRSFRFLTPFIWLFLLGTGYYIYMLITGTKPAGYTALPAMIIPSMLVLFFIIDITLKYLIGKEKVYWVWIIELVLAIIIGCMIIPPYLRGLDVQ